VEPGNDAEALSAMRAGDMRGLAFLHGRHFDAVYRLAWRTLQDEDEADSVTQDVFEVAWRRRRDLELVHGSALNWLLRTAQFKTQHAARRAHRRHPDADLPDRDPTMPAMEDGIVGRLDAASRLQRVQTALSGMSALDSRSFSMTVLGGRTAEDAARALGISTESVRKRVKRARSRLREAGRDE